MKILAIVPTFGMTGSSLPPHLSKTLNGWVKQNIELQIDVIISDNCSSDSVLKQIAHFCKNSDNPRIKFKCIALSSPQISHFSAFNLAIKYMHSFNNKYDYYVYCSDDTVLIEPSDFGKVLNDAVSTGSALTSGRLSKDNCLATQSGYYNDLTSTAPLEIPLGGNVNMHFMIFSRYFMEQYNYKYIDIIPGYGTESILSYLCAAIQKKWVLSRSTTLANVKKGKEKPQSKKSCIVGFKVWENEKTFDEIFLGGKSLGLGFRTLDGGKDAYIPDKNSYDHNGNCRNPESLRQYILSHLFSMRINYDNLLKKITVYS